MANSFLRPEAQPVEQWNRLTWDQQHGLKRLLQMLQEATTNDQGHNQQWRERLPWLFSETRTQLGFINGQRGTGKTTLMTTLVGAIAAPDQFALDTQTSNLNEKEFQECKKLASELTDLVIPCQPLDMEPLPTGTPLLVAILARVYRAVEQYGVDSGSRGSLLRARPRDNREMLSLRQYQERVARALDSNLANRKGHLDSDQYAHAVMRDEECRLQLVSDLEQVLCKLSDLVKEGLGQRKTDDRKVIFLIPIDDVDLNPERCVELLLLLRTFSPPRELFFLLMGQYDMVESIVKLRMASDYGKLTKDGNNLPIVHVESLRNEIAAISAANFRKMLPPHACIDLPLPSLVDSVTFRPLLGNNSPPQQLMELLDRVYLFDIHGERSRYGTLYSLLARRRGKEEMLSNLQDVRDAKSFQWNDYCAAGTFQAPIRQLVDLWMELKSEETTEKELESSSSLQYAQRVKQLFDKHWKRVIDSDPLLSPETRRRLMVNGSREAIVVDSPVDFFWQDFEIENGAITASDETYHPRIRFAGMQRGSGLPHLEIKGQFSRGHDSTTPSAGGSSGQGERIEWVQTCCAVVLFHDLQALYGDNVRSPNEWPKLTSINPVVTAWVGPGGKIAEFAWPIPPLRTFVEMAEFLAAWHQEQGDTLNATIGEGVRESTSVEARTVARLIEKWVDLGIRSIQSSLFGQLAWVAPIAVDTDDEFTWGGISDRFDELLYCARQEHDLVALTQIDTWLRDVVLLVQPEYCSQAVSSLLIEMIEMIEKAQSLQRLI